MQSEESICSAKKHPEVFKPQSTVERPVATRIRSLRTFILGCRQRESGEVPQYVTYLTFQVAGLKPSKISSLSLM